MRYRHAQMRPIATIILGLACLLPMSGMAVPSSPSHPFGEGPGIPGLLVDLRADFAPLPTELPTRPDCAIVRDGESEIDEEDSDGLGDSGVFAHHLLPAGRPLQHPAPLSGAQHARRTAALRSIVFVLRC
jgi:hypothetical protein